MNHYVNLACRLLCETSAEGLVVLTVALAAIRLLRRSSAANRCLVWQAAMVMMILMPGLSTILPAHNIIIPAPPDHVSTVINGSVTRQHSTETPTTITPVNSPGIQVTASSDERTKSGSATSTIRVKQQNQEIPLFPVPYTKTADSSSLFPLIGRMVPDWKVCMLILWAGIMALLAFEAAVGHLRLSNLRTQCMVIADGPIVDLATNLANRLGIRRRIQLLNKPHSMPMAWGAGLLQWSCCQPNQRCGQKEGSRWFCFTSSPISAVVIGQCSGLEDSCVASTGFIR